MRAGIAAAAPFQSLAPIRSAIIIAKLSLLGTVKFVLTPTLKLCNFSFLAELNGTGAWILSKTLCDFSFGGGAKWRKFVC